MNCIKQKAKRKIFIIITILILCNIPPLKWPFTWFDDDDYRYSNNNASFTFEEFQFKERNFDMARAGFLYFKKSCECNDTILYRLNKINPFKFWRYGDYLFKEKYHLPYQKWDSIIARRKPTKNMGVQDF